MGVLLVGSLLLQYGQASESSADTSSSTQTQLAAAERRVDGSATRGARRSDAAVDLTPASEVAPGLVIRSINVDMLTTTTIILPPTTTTTTTTTPPPTTAKPTTTAKQRQAPQATQPAAAGNDVWTRLARCESGGNPKSVGGGGKYYGAFQFSPGTWRSIGGIGLPTDHSYEVQLEFAKKLQARSGWGQWPHCSKVALRG